MVMSIKQENTMKQWLWLVGIWSASILGLSAVSMLFKMLMRWAGLS